VRIGKGPQTRLRASYGSPGFNDEYQAAITGKPLDGRRNKPESGSLTWLWDQYRQTADWTN